MEPLSNTNFFEFTPDQSSHSGPHDSNSMYMGGVAFSTSPSSTSPSLSHSSQSIYQNEFPFQGYQLPAVHDGADAAFSGSEFVNFDEAVLSIVPTITPERADSAMAMSPAVGKSLRSKTGKAQRGEQTPAQTRRKAQNRAAQRAFRERKERRVKDLEEQLAIIQTKVSTLQRENARLKILLQRSQTENKVLRTSAVRRQSSTKSQVSEEHSINAALSDTSLDDVSIVTPASGALSRLLHPNAAWEMVQSHPLCTDGAVDVGLICERLKQLTRCDPSIGPAFDEQEVMQVIEDVARFSEELAT
ncbi:bZIP transcription factor-like protein [Elsinoe fawcettii]|nr:bZIP transcription factor-like protein [Elsinoe fawcettii]